MLQEKGFEVGACVRARARVCGFGRCSAHGPFNVCLERLERRKGGEAHGGVLRHPFPWLGFLCG